MFTPKLPIETADLGLIGNRSLRAFQMIRVGRHPSSVFLLPYGGIWLITGRGPGSGSNGVGKTVLLAALTLLNGDPQWRGEAGVGPYAARLLFDRKRAKVSDTSYPDALRGYLIGVYLHGRRPSDAITVMMRIQRHDSRYVQVRWGDGVLLAEGQTESDRVLAADAIWENMRGGEQLGPKNYADVLFGSSPRCLAYIRARGSEDNQDTGILALGQQQFRPADLANHIIALSGHQQAVIEERKSRQEVAAEELFLTRMKRDDADLKVKERQQLADIESRKRARAHMDVAATHWQEFLGIGSVLERRREADLRAAVGQLESAILQMEAEVEVKERELRELPSIDQLARQHAHDRGLRERAHAQLEKLTKEQGEKELRQRQLATEHGELEAKAAHALGLTVAEADQQLQDAKERETKAVAGAVLQEQQLKAARQELDQIRAGRHGESGMVLAALEDEGIDARRLVDLITLDDTRRAVWEARLSPFAHAVVISATCTETADRARQVLEQHPGIPALMLEQDLDGFQMVSPGDGGPLDALLGTLAARMQEKTSVAVFDERLGLHIWGGFEIPLTDRRAAIRAAEDRVDERRKEWEAATKEGQAATKRRQTAERVVEGARAVVRLTAVMEEEDQVDERLLQLTKAIPVAEKDENDARQVEAESKRAHDEHAERRAGLVTAITKLKTDGDGNLALRRLGLAAARDRASKQAETARQWRQHAGIVDAAAAAEGFDTTGVEADERTRDARLHDACSSLRRAIECVVTHPAASRQQEPPAEEAPDFGSYDGHVAELNAEINRMHAWCAEHKTAAEASRPFDAVTTPLREWLNWYGENDTADEQDIRVRQRDREKSIEAREKLTEETRLWLVSQRELQIRLITDAFKSAEEQLNLLLSVAGRDRVALRFTYVDLGNPDLPLKWEVRPEWVLPAGETVDYSASPNTAELIILHTLLAVSSMVSATQPQGRMVVVDESGNNLDGSNLRRLAGILEHVAARYGLTVVLACQDVYAHLVAPHTASLVKLLRLGSNDVLNARPAVVHGPDEPELVKHFAPYLN